MTENTIVTEAHIEFKSLEEGIKLEAKTNKDLSDHELFILNAGLKQTLHQEINQFLRSEHLHNRLHEISQIFFETMAEAEEARIEGIVKLCQTPSAEFTTER